RPLDDVLKLAHVAGPGVAEQTLVGRLRDAARRALVLARVVLEEEFCEELYVIAPLAQGRYVNRDGRDAVEQIVAEQAVADGVRRESVGRGDEAEVNGVGLLRAELAVAALLKDAQELRLKLHGHLGDLVQEERAALGVLYESVLVGVRAGERALRVAEQLRLDEFFGERGAVDLDEG